MSEKPPIITGSEMSPEAKQAAAGSSFVLTDKQPKILLTPEQREGVKKMVDLFELNKIDDALKIAEKFNLPQEFVESVAKEGMIDRLKNGYIVIALRIMGKFNLPPEVLESAEVQSAAKKRILDLYWEDEIDDAIMFAKKFSLPSEFIQSLVGGKKMIDQLEGGYIGGALEVAEQFHLSLEIIEFAAERGMIYRLKKGYIDSALRIAREFDIPHDFMQSSEVQEAAEKAVIYYIQQSDNSRQVFRVVKEFGVSWEFVDSIIKGKLIEMIRSGFINYVLWEAEKFDLPPESTQEAIEEGMIDLLNSGKSDTARRVVEAPNLPPEVLESAAKKAFLQNIRNGNFALAITISSQFSLPTELTQPLTLSQEMVGENVTTGVYRVVDELLQGTIPKETAALGVTAPGKEGINQLRNILRDFKGKLFDESFNPEALLGSELLTQFTKTYVRFDGSRWGEHGDNDFKNTIADFNEAREADEITPLPAYFQPKDIKVAKADQERQQSFVFSEPFTKRFEVLHNALKDTVHILGSEKKPLTAIETRLTSSLTARKEELTKKLDDPKLPEKAKENIRRNLSDLEKLNLRDLKDFQNNFRALAGYKEMQPDLLVLAMTLALKDHKNFRAEAERMAADGAEANFRNAGWLTEFIGHIVNQETAQKYFADKKAAESLRMITSIKALEEDFARAQNQGTSSATAMTLMPTRGLLMEFSGHIADACWASKYDSMAKQFPNFTSVIFVQNKNTPHERLVGACMLIETKSTGKKKEPLLVIRGLNPIENFINGVSVSDFTEQMFDYVRELAAASGRKAAIVIDDHSGGSGTNRPALFNHLNGLDLNSVPVDKRSTTFNGYDVTGDIYLLP